MMDEAIASAELTKPMNPYKEMIEEMLSKFYWSYDTKLSDFLSRKGVEDLLSRLVLKVVEDIENDIEKSKCDVPKEPKNLKLKNSIADIDSLLKYSGRFNYNKALSDLFSLLESKKELLK